MDLIKYDPSNFSHNFRASVEHAPQNLRNKQRSGMCTPPTEQVRKPQTLGLDASAKLSGKSRLRRHKITSVVMTRQDAVGLMVTSPVIRPTSWNSSYISRYFWLLRALMGLVNITRCFSRKAKAMAYLEVQREQRSQSLSLKLANLKMLLTYTLRLDLP